MLSSFLTFNIRCNKRAMFNYQPIGFTKCNKVFNNQDPMFFLQLETLTWLIDNTFSQNFL